MEEHQFNKHVEPDLHLFEHKSCPIHDLQTSRPTFVYIHMHVMCGYMTLYNVHVHVFVVCCLATKVGKLLATGET